MMKWLQKGKNVQVKKQRNSFLNLLTNIQVLNVKNC